MSDTTAVSVKNVSKQFDNVEVLRDINLTVEKGTVVSILGSSGSGKSTLLRCMNWLEPVSYTHLTLPTICSV